MARPLRAIQQVGMTLIELMVTVLLATLLIGGLFYMMTGQQRTYTNQVNVLSAQENLWGAMEYMERQIRMAGYGFGACGSTILAMGTGDGGVDSLTSLRVHNNNNLFTVANDGTDSLEVRYAVTAASGQQNLRITKEHPINASSFWASGIGDPLKDPIQDGDLIVMCLPGFPATLMQITGTPAQMPQDYDGDGIGDWKLKTNPNTINPPNWNNLFGPGAKYPQNASFVKFGATKLPRTFAIDNAHNPPRLVTWQLGKTIDLEIVASGIEDMQIAWACDTEGAPGNGIFTEGVCSAGSGVSCKCSTDDCSAKVGDEWANNVASDSLPICNENPIQRVRLTLIARTDAPVVADKRGKRPEAEDHYEGTSADDLAKTDNLGTYSRAVLTSTVVPRNIKVKQ